MSMAYECGRGNKDGHMLTAMLSQCSDWDQAMVLRVADRTPGPLVAGLMILLSRSADGVMYPLYAGVLRVAEPDKAGPLLGCLLAAFAMELPLFKLLKHLVRRDRPCAAVGVSPRISIPDHFSFPSGHTAGAFVLAGVVHAFQLPWSGLLWLWAACVGVSRVYNGVHYPTDVAAGALLGWGCARLALSLLG